MAKRGVDLYLYSFLITVLEDVRDQRHAPAALYLLERPGTHCTGDWIGPQGWCGQVRKISPPPVFDPRTIKPVTTHYTD